MSYYRYKKYKRRSGNTNVVRMRFQSFMDIATDDQSMQVITVSAGGKEIVNRLPAQFSAYKYYKIGSVSIKLVPAATLPVSPSGLSYEVDEPGVDPRDQMTPGLVRITNGEDVFENITGLSDTEQHAIYNNMMLDPRWFKWMLQSGMKRYATPRYWIIGQLHQDKWPGAITNLPERLSTSTDTVTGTVTTVKASTTGLGASDAYAGGSSAYGIFQVGHTGRLGWLPTDGLQPVNFGGTIKNIPLIASPPEVEVLKILLPKAFKTKYYYRMYITETVLFREPIVTMCGYGQMRPLDIFHHSAGPIPALPQTIASGTWEMPMDGQTGGNYGDN